MVCIGGAHTKGPWFDSEMSGVERNPRPPAAPAAILRRPRHALSRTVKEPR